MTEVKKEPVFRDNRPVENYPGIAQDVADALTIILTKVEECRRLNAELARIFRMMRTLNYVSGAGGNVFEALLNMAIQNALKGNHASATEALLYRIIKEKDLFKDEKED